MNLIKTFGPLIEVLVLAIIAFAMHKILLSIIFGDDVDAYFQYSLPSLYLFFGCLSIAIVTILIFIYRADIDSVGQTFMLLTCIKIGFVFWFGQKIMSSNTAFAHLEKINYLIVFCVFLTVETLVTVRLLNKVQ